MWGGGGLGPRYPCRSWRSALKRLAIMGGVVLSLIPIYGYPPLIVWFIGAAIIGLIVYEIWNTLGEAIGDKPSENE